jgi:thioredoxin 1
MSVAARTAVLVGVAVVVLAGAEACGSRPSATERRPAETPAADATRPIPRLVDLGAGKCIPCKAMAPILDQLRADYAGRLEVTFIDVWQKPDEGQAHQIRMIPTQIFYGADGRELARHEGFISREEILSRWKALGVEL